MPSEFSTILIIFNFNATKYKELKKNQDQDHLKNSKSVAGQKL